MLVYQFTLGEQIHVYTSLQTCPTIQLAITKPAAGGTKGVLPGTRPPEPVTGSGENTTGIPLRIPFLRKETRTARAKGQVWVLAISVISIRVGSSLLPIPRLEIMGFFSP